jgi:hypothetical protein
LCEQAKQSFDIGEAHDSSQLAAYHTRGCFYFVAGDGVFFRATIRQPCCY